MLVRSLHLYDIAVVSPVWSVNAPTAYVVKFNGSEATGFSLALLNRDAAQNFPVMPKELQKWQKLQQT